MRQTRVTTPVKAWCRESQRGTFRRVATVNVSAGGVCLETETPVARGTALAVTLRLESRPVTFKGRVVWSARGRVGVAFEHGPAADEGALLKWVYRQSCTA